MAYGTRPRQQCTRGRLLRDYGSVCSGFVCTSGNWWSGAKSGPGVQAESIMQVSCNGCDRIIKSVTHCNTRERLFQNVCRSVKIQVVEISKWICDSCKWENVRLLREKLQNDLPYLKLKV